MVLPIFLLKTTGSSKKFTSKVFKADDNEIVGGNSGRANKTVMNLSKNNKSRKLTSILNIRATKKSNFLIPNAKKALNYLRLVFIKILIF